MNPQPQYSLIIPAYNEEDWLAATLHVLAQAMAEQSMSGELIVVDNNSSDSTAALARELGAQVVFEGENQISRARNTGSRAARGEYLIFIDADTHIQSQLLSRALENLHSGQSCGGGSTLYFDRMESALARHGVKLWNRVSRRARWAAGCFVYIRRDCFEAIGGFSEQVYASEEIWLSRAARRWGRERDLDFNIIEDWPALSSGRKEDWFSSTKQYLVIFMLMFFPFFVRFRSLCFFWYKRP